MNRVHLLFLVGFVWFPPITGVWKLSPQGVTISRGSQRQVAGTRHAHAGDASLIQPGRRIGPLKLGDTRQRALEVFPPKSQVDQEHKYSNLATCGTHYVWVNLSKHDYGANVSIQFKDGLVSQIGSMLSKYHTVEGITVNTRPERLQRYFSALRAYVLFGTASEAVNQRPLTFWVDWEKGIAFCFVTNRRLNKRVIWDIIVFDPKGSFCPEGQNAAPPDWQELPPYTLEPTKEMELRWKESE